MSVLDGWSARDMQTRRLHCSNPVGPDRVGPDLTFRQRGPAYQVHGPENSNSTNFYHCCF